MQLSKWRMRTRRCYEREDVIGDVTAQWSCNHNNSSEGYSMHYQKDSYCTFSAVQSPLLTAFFAVFFTFSVSICSCYRPLHQIRLVFIHRILFRLSPSLSSLCISTVFRLTLRPVSPAFCRRLLSSSLVSSCAADMSTVTCARCRFLCRAVSDVLRQWRRPGHIPARDFIGR